MCLMAKSEIISIAVEINHLGSFMEAKYISKHILEVTVMGYEPTKWTYYCQFKHLEINSYEDSH